MPKSKIRAKVAAQRKNRPVTSKYRLPKAPWHNYLDMESQTDDPEGLAMLSVWPFGVQVDGEQDKPVATSLKDLADQAEQSVRYACQQTILLEMEGLVWWDQTAQVMHLKKEKDE